jgi:hypothetical protein
MAIRRAAPKPHSVIVDTNILWHEDKKYAVAPEFDTAWDENGKLVGLELVVPEVVRSELAFQQTTAVWNRLDQVTKLLGEISGIAASTHATRITRKRLREQVEAKIDRWLRNRRARIPAVPYQAVDWSRVTSDAVWRRPPFTFDSKKTDAEKGFRDSLILETVAHEVAREARDVNIVFIAADNLLRKTAAERMRSETRFTVHDSMSAFSSYVRLTREELDNEFIRAILDRAAEKFFTPDDDQSLYLRENILSKIGDQFAAYFSDPEKADKSSFKLPASMNLSGPWQAPNPGRWWIAGSDFVSIEPERIFHWRTKVWFARAYRRRSTLAFTIVVTPPEPWDERLLYLQFDVYWKALVKADARFYNIELERIDLGDHGFRIPDEQERTAFGFAGSQPAG